MYFKIDNNKVSEVGKFFVEKSEELDGLYNDALEICNKIEENYRSEDSTIYLAKFRKYIKTFILENNHLRLGGSVLNKASSLYSDQEDKWAKTIMQKDLYKRGHD